MLIITDRDHQELLLHARVIGDNPSNNWAIKTARSAAKARVCKKERGLVEIWRRVGYIVVKPPINKLITQECFDDLEEEENDSRC